MYSLNCIDHALSPSCLRSPGAIVSNWLLSLSNTFRSHSPPNIFEYPCRYLLLTLLLLVYFPFIVLILYRQHPPVTFQSTNEQQFSYSISLVMLAPVPVHEPMRIPLQVQMCLYKRRTTHPALHETIYLPVSSSGYLSSSERSLLSPDGSTLSTIDRASWVLTGMLISIEVVGIRGAHQESLQDS